MTFNLRAYRAACDGVTDDTAAWFAAVAAATPTGGTVTWDPSATRITGEIVVPAGVNVQGEGHGADGGSAYGSRIILSGPSARLTFGADGRTSGGERGGRSGDFNLVGDGTTLEGLRVNRCASRTFDGIDIKGTVRGVVLRGAQNCVFEQITTETCAGDAWTLDCGPGGNAFIRCGANASGGYDVAFRQTADPSTQGYRVPSDNYWFGCIFEREHPTLGSQGAVYHGCGLRNIFVGGVFSKLPTTPRSIIKMTQGDTQWQSPSRELYLISPSFQGSQANSTAIELASSGCNVRLGSWPRAQNLAALYSAAEGSGIYEDGAPPVTSSVTASLIGAQDALQRPPQMTVDAVGKRLGARVGTSWMWTQLS